ncbi:hypothetical protein [Hymenobacter ginsengisoli]|uniref:hypothetical protein n=1 Tax=Hymenobacter ginsengisoli TaxID=1051626 RepID=UPI0031EBEA0E
MSLTGQKALAWLVPHTLYLFIKRKKQQCGGLLTPPVALPQSRGASAFWLQQQAVWLNLLFLPERTFALSINQKRACYESG